MSFCFTPRTKGASLSVPLRFSTVLLTALGLVEALDDAPAPPGPAWPPPDAAITAERADALLAHFEGDERIAPRPTAAEKRAYAAYAEAKQRWLATPSAREGAVPSFKFQSNDPWIVSAPEAARVAAALEELFADEDQFELLCDVLDVTRAESKAVRAGLEKFRRFNARCAKGEGYTVS